MRAAESTAAVRDLSDALAGLSPQRRACRVPHDLYGLGYGEIADVLGIGRQAVRGRTFRARRYLMEAMSAWR